MERITFLPVVNKLKSGSKKKVLILVICNGSKLTVKFVQDAKDLLIRTRDVCIWCVSVDGNSAGYVLANGLNMEVKTHMPVISMRVFRKLIRIYKTSRKESKMPRKNSLDTNSTMRDFKTIVLRLN